jgi:hypothetical protein
MHAFAEVQDTELRSLLSAAGGTGVLCIDQPLPFQSSANETRVDPLT